MYAITVQQPWAEAIARHSCNVLNRSRRPPAHLIGQRVAIHVGKSWSDWAGLVPADLVRWTANALVKGPPPHAGRIIATARLVGYVHNAGSSGLWHASNDDAMAVLTDRSPWLTGPVGWVLDAVRALAVPVDGGYTLRFEGCRPDCFSEGCPTCDGRSWVQRRISIRGQVYPFALSPEIEAAILRQEG